MIFHCGYTNQFTFPTTVHEVSLFSTSLPASGICCLVDDGQSDRCEVMYHYYFDLHFPDN